MDSHKPSVTNKTLEKETLSIQRRAFLAGTTAIAITSMGHDLAAQATTTPPTPGKLPDKPAEFQPQQLKRHRVGSIGTGGRWSSVGRAAMEFGDVVALCDVDSRHLETAAKAVEKHQGHRPLLFENYEELLACDDIEVVTIVTPDHWHSKIAIEAMRAGKHVYCEKPLTLTIEEGNQIIRVLEETGRIFQVGTQQRTEFEGRFLTAVAICQDKRLGTIRKVVCGIGGAPESEPIPVVNPPKELNWELWLGPAPFAEFRYAQRPKGRPATRAHYEFRWWYETSGGKMTDWGAHHVDIAQWALGKSDTSPIFVNPVSARHPVPLDDQGNANDPSRYNTATEFLVSCKFADDTELEISSSAPNGILFLGDEGELFVSRKELRGDAVNALKEHPLSEELLMRLCKGRHRPLGPHPHMRNFFTSIEHGEQPISDVYSHHRAMTTCHLANIAMRLGRSVRWDPEAQQILDDPQAASMQMRRPREGFEVDV